jgi:hypothetical protein
MENNPIEKCILCGKDTTYHFNDHIDFRIGYIEGAGQLCKSCHDRGTNRNYMTIPENLVYNTPNDQELGGKVREIYWQHKQ